MGFSLRLSITTLVRTIGLPTGGNLVSELPTPPNLGSDPDATELLRVWIINEELECSLYPGAFDEPALWGAILAELARNISKGLQETEGKDYQATLDLIVNAFQQDIANPPES